MAEPDYGEVDLDYLVLSDRHESLGRSHAILANALTELIEAAAGQKTISAKRVARIANDALKAAPEIDFEAVLED